MEKSWAKVFADELFPAIIIMHAVSNFLFLQFMGEQKVDRELTDSVLEVSIGANKRIVEKLIGYDSMCQPG